MNADQIDRATIERTKEELLDGLQFAQHRLKDFQLQAAMGGDEQPMADEMAKIERIEAKLAGLGYGLVQVEQNERAAMSAQRAAERQEAIEYLRSALGQHGSALTELSEGLAKLLPIADQIGPLAKDIEHGSLGLFPAQAIDPMSSFPSDRFLVSAGVYQAPDVTKALRSLIDFAHRVAENRGSTWQELVTAVPDVEDEDVRAAALADVRRDAEADAETSVKNAGMRRPG